MMDEPMGLMIAVLVVAVLCAALLAVVLMQIRGIRGAIADLDAKLKAATARPPTPQLPPALEDRLDAIEDGIRSLPAAYDRLERTIRSGRESQGGVAASIAPSRNPPPRRETDQVDVTKHPPKAALGSPTVTVASESSSAVMAERRNPPAPAPGNERNARAKAMVEAYRELIARPRKAEIARWFEDLGSLPCEASDEDVLHPVGRGDGARLMLVPVDDTVAMILPSALMVVDFATSFSDVLSARSAVRRTFEMDADGSGMLRLLQPAVAVLMDGAWRLKTSGRLGGLANG